MASPLEPDGGPQNRSGQGDRAAADRPGRPGQPAGRAKRAASPSACAAAPATAVPRPELPAADRIEQAADRAAKVVRQIRQRSAGENITDRLVSMPDPDARPIRQGKLHQPNEFGDVFQLARSVRRPAAARAARSFPPSPRRGRATTCSLPAPPKSTVSTSRRARSRRMAGPSAGGAEDLPDVDRRLHRSSPVGRRQVPIAGWPSSAWAARAASAERRFGLKRPGSKVTTTPAAGPPGRSSPTTSTPSPSDRPRSIPSASGSSPGANLQPGPRHPAAVLVLQRSRFIRGQVTSG